MGFSPFPLLLILLASAAPAADLRGKVAAVSGSEVTIVLDSPLLPNPGDPVRISFEAPGAGEIALDGSWSVKEATAGRIIAQAAPGASTRPQPGQIATISSANPRSPAPPSAPAPSQPPLALPPSGSGAPVTVPGSTSPSTPPPAGPEPAPAPAAVFTPPSAPSFSIRHAHPTFRRTFSTTATLMLPPGRVTYREVGEDAKAEHNFDFSCQEFKGARQGIVNRGENASIQNLSLRNPVKLLLRAKKSYGQMFEERDKIAEIVRALQAHCGKR
jgi:hypothetical protein